MRTLQICLVSTLCEIEYTCTYCPNLVMKFVNIYCKYLQIKYYNVDRKFEKFHIVGAIGLACSLSGVSSLIFADSQGLLWHWRLEFQKLSELIVDICQVHFADTAKWPLP